MPDVNCSLPHQRRSVSCLAQRFLALSALAGVLLAAAPQRAEERVAQVLYFTHSAGYRHEVVPFSQQVLKQLGKESGAFEVTATEDVAALSAPNLRRFAAVIFYTTGELPMSSAQKVALLSFVRSGRGFLGVHSATDTFYRWREYGKLIGGYFDGHPWRQGVTIEVADASSPLVAALAPALRIADEIYQIRDFDDRGSRVLLRLDPASVDLTIDGVHRRGYGWPLAWTRSYGRGRVFYTALGHEEAVWRDARFQQLLVNAVLWATRSDKMAR
jgi:type 1 glutamine amidotransferase